MIAADASLADLTIEPPGSSRRIGTATRNASAGPAETEPVLPAFLPYRLLFLQTSSICQPGPTDKMARNKLVICSIFGLLIAGGFCQRRPVNQEVAGRFRALQAQEREIDQTIWADEMLAQEYEQVFIDMMGNWT